MREQSGHADYWWEKRWFLVALILLSAAPLLYPKVPPLVDLFGHIGRYRVQLDIGSSEWLQRYYTFDWAAIGNLGVDILVMPLGKLLGLENAVKLIVLVIPPLTVTGFLWVAREVHGRIPPTALFALPFVLGQPFLFGFVNFALSMALAFLAFGLWLRLGRLGKTRLRALLFVPISVVVFFTHTYGWGALGLMCFSAEAVRQHDRGKPWLKAGVDAALPPAGMVVPLIIMLAWRSETHGGQTGRWFDVLFKIQWVISALRDRWHAFDVACVIVALIMIVEARRQKELSFSRNLAFSALVLFGVFLLLPFVIFGSAYADMRLVPYAFAVALLAIRFRDADYPPKAATIAVLGLAFFLVRIGSTTASLAIAANEQGRHLEALDRLPMGARVVFLVGQSCGTSWALPRDTHLGGMVIVRRHGFANDQWVIEGANLLGVKYKAAGKFVADPSQMVMPNNCNGPYPKVDEALGNIPNGAFDYVWMVNAPPASAEALKGLAPVWRGPASVLYRIER